MVTGTAPKPAEVQPLTVYTLQDVRSIFGIGRDGLRAARKKGLVVRRCGRKSFVLGHDLARYLESCPVVA